MAAENPLLTELLSQHGYETGMAASNPFLAEELGFWADEFYTTTQPYRTGMNVRKFFNQTKNMRKYRRYIEFLHRSVGRDLPYHLANALQFKYGYFDGEDDGANKVTRWTTGFLAQATSPVFLYLHYTETHMNTTDDLPYSVPDDDLFQFVDRAPSELPELETRGGTVEYSDEQTEAHERLYDGAIRYLDGHIKQIIDALEANGMWEDTLLVITSDHGELIGEHGLLGHGSLYEPGVHVPLVIRPPGGRNSIEIEQRVNTINLYQTLLEAAGIDTHNTTGINLLSDQLNAEETIVVQNHTPKWKWSRYETEGDSIYAVYRDELKLIKRGGERELYELGEDADESENLINTRPDLANSLEDELDKKLEEVTDTDRESNEVEFDAATQKRLQDLGYIE